jgi:amidohydrolase
MNELKNRIGQLSRKYFDEIVAIRRQLHARPELSKQEHQTAETVAKFLRELGVEVQTGVAGTGVVATIYGQNPEKKTVALRADMDALPIREENNVEYRSLTDGVMHACGHDVHTASLLGTAKILQELQDAFEGTVRLFFQPSEEQYPGGAKEMIGEGVLENPRPAHVFAQHVYPALEAGKVGMKPGKYMASTDEVFITVKGKGGHAALPMNCIDPLLIASHIVVALQQIVSRNTAPDVPAVVSFGRFIADGHTNVIPDEVKLEGIVRTFDEQWRKEIHRKITRMAQSIAEGMGGSCEVFIDQGYPYVYNDPQVTENTRRWAVEYLGKENVVDLPLRMTAEDFAYFAREVPSCFYRLGVRNEQKGIVSELHSATFDVDEKSLETGMGLMAWIAVNALKENDNLTKADNGR